MGLFGKKHQEPSMSFDEEVKYRVWKMADPTIISPESLSLQVFVLEEKQKKNAMNMVISTDVLGNMTDWTIINMHLEGYEYVYKKAIDDVEKWLDPDSLEKEYSFAIETARRESDRKWREYWLGQAEAIAGLQGGELYYAWSDSTKSMKVNPALIEILKHRGLY